MRNAAPTQEILTALRRFWHGRRVGVVSPGFNRSAQALATQARRFGAQVDVFVGAHSQAGIPGQDWHSWFARDNAAPGMSRASFEAFLASRPPALGRWLDAIDPSRTLTLLGGVFTEVPELFGRKFHGWRRPEWAEWEDKTRIDELFARAAVRTPPHLLVDTETPRLSSEFLSLTNAGHGFIVAMDSSEGHVGDAKGLRWIRRAAELPRFLASVRGRFRRVRIAPFLEGIPCSILGLVLKDGVAVFDPLEVVTLRDTRANELLFCGTSNRWRPPPSATLSMREATRRAGRELAAHAGYRGFYSVDGLLTPEGFLATELNPRQASGLGLNNAERWFPDYLFQRAVQEGMHGVWSVPHGWVEREFRNTIAAQPSHRISWEADSVIEGEHARFEEVNGRAYRVAFSVVQGALDLASIDPMPNLLGPVIAALARRLTHSGWQSAVETGPAIAALSAT